MKKILFFAFVAMIAMTGSAQQLPKRVPADGYYTNECKDRKLVREARKWLRKGEWRHGFTKADPHESVNVVDFYLQYKKNPEAWGRMFEYLADTDLLAVPKGKTPIPGTNLVLNVQDSKNEPLEKRRSESHYKGIDFQYCVKGTERFGILDHKTSVPNCLYKPDVIHYDYDKERTLFYDSTPDKFFIFFPGDWHIAKVANDTQDQDIRVVVVKVQWEE